MLEFIGGVALGAAFAPFWIMVWKGVKTKVTAFLK